MNINNFALPAAIPTFRDNEPPAPPEMPPETYMPPTLEQLIDRSTRTLNRSLENMLKCQPNINKVVGELLNGNPALESIAEFKEQVEAKRIRWQMCAQELGKFGAVMKHCRETLPMEQRQLLDEEPRDILVDLKTRHAPPPEIAEAFDSSISSSDDFFDKLLELIDLIKNGYLAGYEHLIAAYSEFFSDFNELITAKMKDWIEGAGDGKEVKLDTKALKEALEALIRKYSHPNPESVLFPAPGMEGASKEEAEKWLKALGLPASCLKPNGDGTYSVVMDLGPLTLMLDGIQPGTGWVTWDTAKFQSWQTGFNAQEERMKNMLQTFTQKYSNANSYHDNFNKTLSSHLNQYADMLKAMLNF